MPPEFKIFNGKRYHLHMIKDSKPSANAVAKKMRRKGLLARVHPYVDFSQTRKQGKKRTMYALYTK